METEQTPVAPELPIPLPVPEIRKEPLWRNVVEKMKAEGITHGKVYEAAWFEEQLSCTRRDMAFGLSISKIRRELEKSGFYLSGRGMHGNQFVVMPCENHRKILSQYARKAMDAQTRGVILGTNTRLDLLDPAERAKHESIIERMAHRLVLMQHSEAVHKIVNKQHKLLNAAKAA